MSSKTIKFPIPIYPKQCDKIQGNVVSIKRAREASINALDDSFEAINDIVRKTSERCSQVLQKAELQVQMGHLEQAVTIYDDLNKAGSTEGFYQSVLLRSKLDQKSYFESFREIFDHCHDRVKDPGLLLINNTCLEVLVQVLEIGKQKKYINNLDQNQSFTDLSSAFQSVNHYLPVIHLKTELLSSLSNTLNNQKY